MNVFIRNVKHLLDGHQFQLNRIHSDNALSVLKLFTPTFPEKIDVAEITTIKPFHFVSIRFRFDYQTVDVNLIDRLLSLPAIRNAHWLTLTVQNEEQLQGWLQNRYKEWLYHDEHSEPNNVIRVLEINAQFSAITSHQAAPISTKVKQKILELVYLLVQVIFRSNEIQS